MKFDLEYYRDDIITKMEDDNGNSNRTKMKFGYKCMRCSYIALFLFCSLFIVGTTKNNDISSQFNHVQFQMNEIETIIKKDIFKQESIKKILTIINNYESVMDSVLRCEVANVIFEMTIKYQNLDIDLICATITHESARTWNPVVKSPVGAIGLMQIMPSTGEMLVEMEGIEWYDTILNDPIINIKLGSMYLSTLIEMYEIDGGLAAYNGGPRRAERWIRYNKADNILPDETQKYIPFVLGYYKLFLNMDDSRIM